MPTEVETLESTGSAEPEPLETLDTNTPTAFPTDDTTTRDVQQLPQHRFVVYLRRSDQGQTSALQTYGVDRGVLQSPTYGQQPSLHSPSVMEGGSSR